MLSAQFSSAFSNNSETDSEGMWTLCEAVVSVLLLQSVGIGKQESLKSHCSENSVMLFLAPSYGTTVR